MAVREDEAALPPDLGFDCLDLRSRVVAISDEGGERTRVAVPRRFGQEASTVLQQDGRRWLARVAARRDEKGGCRRKSHEADEKEQGGPPSRAALAVVAGLYLIVNFACPVETLPLMSVAIHRNVVVSVRWKTSPGSRGPVESQSGELSVGFDPSVV